MNPSTTAIQLLMDLGKLGIDVQAHGDAIRFRPPSSMTPVLLDRMKASKAALLRLLDLDTAMLDLRQSVEALCGGIPWRLAWEQRFRLAEWADFASLRSVLDDALEQAAAHHRKRDWFAFASSWKYIHRLAQGDLWDESSRTAPAKVRA